MTGVMAKFIKTFLHLNTLPLPSTVLIMLLFIVSFYASSQNVLLDSIELNHYKPVAVNIKTYDEFMLSANYYAGDKDAGGVIVLHDCESHKGTYADLSESIAQQGLHTLLVDLRGYGASVSEVYSHNDVKSNAINIVNFQAKMAQITAHWTEDLLAAYQVLSKKIDKDKGIAVLASGCTSAYAVSLAEKVKLNALVMITPKMADNDKERYKRLVDIPNYFITSVYHQLSYDTAQELFRWNGNKRSKIQTFNGSGFNSQLLYRQNNLVKDIALWLKTGLSQ